MVGAGRFIVCPGPPGSKGTQLDSEVYEPCARPYETLLTEDPLTETT